MNYTEILEDDYKEDVWYPDDSGLWIETYGQDFTLHDNCKTFTYMLNSERIKMKAYLNYRILDSYYLENWDSKDFSLVCAYKVLS